MMSFSNFNGKVALILAFLSLGQLAQAQQNQGEIRGIVLSSQTREAVPFANVRVAGSTQGAATDFDGTFVLKLDSGSYELVTSTIGLDTDTTEVFITAGKTYSVTILLAPSAMTINQLEIVQRKDALNLTMMGSSNRLAGVTKSGRRRGFLKRWRPKGGMHQATPVNVVSQVSNTESYKHKPENSFSKVSHDPLSTFSIDVDAASYANVRRMINRGEVPPNDAVRVEEMINYFQYDYEQPKGEHPFAIHTEVSTCPWNQKHRLVHIGLQGVKVDLENLPAQNLVFLLDVSGSMSDFNKLGLVKKSMRMLVRQMRPPDRISMVVYAGAAGLVLPSTSGKKKDKILDAIEKLSAGGSTAGGEGIRLAYDQAIAGFIEEGNNRVILCTDGDFNVGTTSDKQLVKLIREKRELGVFLTVLGYGMGNYKDAKMEKLADNGNGNYAYIDNILEAKKVLITEIGGTLQTIAKDVKIQVEFNPTKVASYRLIGYENRLLEEEDFNDDAKDAGELGAGHTVTALYEIVPLDKGGNDPSVPDIDPLRYQEKSIKAVDSLQNELLTVKFRYKTPKGRKSQLITNYLFDHSKALQNTSNAFRFSAAVASFAMLLTDSEHKGVASVEMVMEMAKKAKGSDRHGYRAEFIRMVETWELTAFK